LKVTLLQTDISWAQPAENIRQARQLLSQSEESELYVLPEMWSTGFATEPEGIAAEQSDNAALSWMTSEAAARHCAISGSLAVRLDDGTYRNRHYFVDGITGSVSYYDKHHLFTYGHEHHHYTAGQQHTVVSYGGFRLLLLTCYDLRFPVWSRYGRAGEYDAIIIAANWPEKRQQAWRILTRARAIENQCYLVGANRVGDDQYCHYLGESVVCGPQGETLLDCEAEREAAKTVELDFDALEHVRSRFRVLDDRDDK
jgi:predicted amidohydrolase